MNDLRTILTDSIPRDACGIEIGAHLLPIQGLSPYYIDIVESYASQTSRVDLIADAMLLPIPSGELDFVCASHVLEHLPNPIGALFEWHRVLREGGLLYMVIPDKRFTFDRDRRTTEWSHLVSDFIEDRHFASREEIRSFIYESDWEVLRPGSVPERRSIEQKLHFDWYMAQTNNGAVVDIHYHVFSPASVDALLRRTRLLGHPFPYFRLLGSAERHPQERGDGIGILLQKRRRMCALPSWTEAGTFRLENAVRGVRPLRLVAPETLEPLSRAHGLSVGFHLETQGRGRRLYSGTNDHPCLLRKIDVPRRRPWSRALVRRWMIGGWRAWRSLRDIDGALPVGARRMVPQ